MFLLKEQRTYLLKGQRTYLLKEQRHSDEKIIINT